MYYKDKDGNIYYAGTIDDKKTIMVKHNGQSNGQVWNNNCNYKFRTDLGVQCYLRNIAFLYKWQKLKKKVD